MQELASGLVIADEDIDLPQGDMLSPLLNPQANDTEYFSSKPATKTILGANYVSLDMLSSC